MVVYVIMGNDFPECVFATQKEADAFVEAKMKAPENRREHSNLPRIYWRSYEFRVR